MIAFIGDIHGDLQPLRWALSVTAGMTRIAMGDVVDGPNDGLCIELLREHEVLVLQGNHDYGAACDDFASQPQQESVRHWLASLPKRHHGRDWLAYHSHYEERYGYLSWQYLNDAGTVRRAFASEAEQIIFCGHTHVPAVQVLNEGQLSVIHGQTLLQSPTIALAADERYLVHVGRPTQCVVLWDEDARHLEFIFHPEPRFERRFRELLTPG